MNLFSCNCFIEVKSIKEFELVKLILQRYFYYFNDKVIMKDTLSIFMLIELNKKYLYLIQNNTHTIDYLKINNYLEVPVKEIMKL